MTKFCKKCGRDLTFNRYGKSLLCMEHGREQHNADQRLKKYWRNTPSWRARVRKYDKDHPEKYADRLQKARDKKKNG